MKFVVDAQLPRKLSDFLQEKGYDSIHTLDLPEKNRSGDEQIAKLSIKEKRVVISKDSDFYDRYQSKLEPYKLLFLTTGNISNRALLDIIDKNLDQILATLEEHAVVELSRESIITII